MVCIGAQRNLKQVRMYSGIFVGIYEFEGINLVFQNYITTLNGFMTETKEILDKARV